MISQGCDWVTSSDAQVPECSLHVGLWWPLSSALFKYPVSCPCSPVSRILLRLPLLRWANQSPERPNSSSGPKASPWHPVFSRSVQLTSVAQLCPILCNPLNCSMPGFPVHHQLLEFTQTHVHWVSDAIQPSHPLSSPSPTFSLSLHQGLFQWVSSSHQVAKVLELQLQHRSFQWIFRIDFL